jgi:hypothetical protein
MNTESTRITVAVAGICSAGHLYRCLDSIAHQEDAPRFDVLVICDPGLDNLDVLRAHFPDFRIIVNEGQDTPVELGSCLAREATGDLILYTEDSCTPAPNWVRVMVDAQAEGRAVVGGRIEARPNVTALDWAFYFVDFFRYAGPLEPGPVPTLSVCNTSYKKAELESVRPVWEAQFHETAVNEALRGEFGSLWIEPRSEVLMHRHVRFSDAVYERYAFGRLFGCTRSKYVSTTARWLYAAAAPLLPILILGRMFSKVQRSAPLRPHFARAFAPLLVLVFAWSWGEFIGYVTLKHPGSVAAAHEIAPLPLPSTSEPEA